MKIETIDLYEYFKAERKNGESRGFLTAYRHGQMSEMRSRKVRPASSYFPAADTDFCRKGKTSRSLCGILRKDSTPLCSITI